MSTPTQQICSETTRRSLVQCPTLSHKYPVCISEERRELGGWTDGKGGERRYEGGWKKWGGANDDKNKQNNKQRKSRRQFDSSQHTPTRSWNSLVYQLCVIAPLIICHASPHLSCALSRDETLRNKRQTGPFAARTHLDRSQTGRGAPQVAALDSTRAT